MSDFLCLRFKQIEITALSKVAWSVLGADGRIQSSGHALLCGLEQSVPEAKGARRNIVIVPSSAILLTSADVPVKQHRHLKQVLGFVVEEQIIDPIESMHLATPAYHASEGISIAAVKRDLIENWLAALEQVDILPDYLFADVLCVPQKVGDWQLLFEDNKVLFRDAICSGITLDKNTAESVIRLAIAKNIGSSERADQSSSNDTDTLEVVGAAPNLSEQATGAHQVALLVAAEEDLAALAALDDLIIAANSEDTLGNLNDTDLAENGEGLRVSTGSDVDRDTQDLAFVRQAEAEEEPALLVSKDDFKDYLGDFIRSENIETREIAYTETSSDLLAVNAVHNVETTLNLLQGEFSPISANAANRKFIRSASLAVAACIGLFLFVTMAGGYYLNYQADNYFSKSVAIYRDVFPKQIRVPDPVKQMQRQLSGKAVGGTTSDFLPLLDAASRSLISLETEVPSTITQLRYDIQRGHIIIDLRTMNIDVLEAYKEQLLTEGLKVDILSANQDQEMINGRMQIGRS